MTSESLADLGERIRQLARVPSLLVACDYDGTMAPLVDNPMDARPNRDAVLAVRSLAEHASTHVAVISGRSLRDLATLSRFPEEVRLVGSHGSEFDLGFASQLNDELLSSSGRRLSEILGRLAEDLLTLVLAADATTVAGAFLNDGVTAALNLIPRAVIMPQLQAGDELRALLAQLGAAGLRLLALDGDVGATFAHIGDRVWAHGAGNVTLIGFHQDADSGQPTARLKLLTDGMQSAWPS